MKLAKRREATTTTSMADMHQTTLLSFSRKSREVQVSKKPKWVKNFWCFRRAWRERGERGCQIVFNRREKYGNANQLKYFGGCNTDLNF